MANERYDGSLQMFVDAPREPDMARLTFMRWLIENNRLEHAAAGAPAGELAVGLAPAGDIFDAKAQNPADGGPQAA